MRRLNVSALRGTHPALLGQFPGETFLAGDCCDFSLTSRSNFPLAFERIDTNYKPQFIVIEKGRGRVLFLFLLLKICIRKNPSFPRLLDDCEMSVAEKGEEKAKKRDTSPLYSVNSSR